MTETLPAIGLALPPLELRMGGAHFREDADFVAAAIRDVALLQRHAGLTRESRLVDWGCGAGRLAVGIRQSLGHVRDYHGVDVQPSLLHWARDHLTDEHTRFTLVDQRNERYNPDGTSTFAIPADTGSVDVLYAYSVFSHMLEIDVRGYAQTIAAILAPHGRAVMTVFVENGVPDCEENPAEYRKLPWKGRLHCVRYDRQFFEQLLWDAGLAVDEFVYGRETDGQSLYSLRLRSSL
jgi:cyclopropane fatty-acyl-phospholipid synthase-like methyltransferase